MKIILIILALVLLFFVIRVGFHHHSHHESYLSTQVRKHREGYETPLRRRQLESFTENYGGNQSTCETECYSSQYYDACMHVCMEGSSADFTGRPDEYTLDALEAPIALDEENGSQYYSTFAGPYRYETPGGQ